MPCSAYQRFCFNICCIQIAALSSTCKRNVTWLCISVQQAIMLTGLKHETGRVLLRDCIMWVCCTIPYPHGSLMHQNNVTRVPLMLANLMTQVSNGCEGLHVDCNSAHETTGCKAAGSELTGSQQSNTPHSWHVAAFFASLATDENSIHTEQYDNGNISLPHTTSTVSLWCTAKPKQAFLT